MIRGAQWKRRFLLDPGSESGTLYTVLYWRIDSASGDVGWFSSQDVGVGVPAPGRAVELGFGAIYPPTGMRVRITVLAARAKRRGG
jgi:hypothetical protein